MGRPCGCGRGGFILECEFLVRLVEVFIRKCLLWVLCFCYPLCDSDKGTIKARTEHHPGRSLGLPMCLARICQH